LGNKFCRTISNGGGVALYVSNSLSFQTLDLNFLCEEGNIEVTGIMMKSLNMIVVSIYRAPSGIPRIFIEKLEELLIYLHKWKNWNIVIGGDINSHFDVSKEKPSVTELKNLLSQFNCHCANKKPTRGDACLDNIFTNLESILYKSSVIPFPFSDHECVCLSVKRYPTSLPSRPNDFRYVTTRPITDTKLLNFRLALCDVDWEKLLSQSNYTANEAFDRFLTVFIAKYNDEIPKKTCKVNINNFSRKKKTTWYTPRLAKMKCNLMTLIDIHKNNKTEESKLAYLKYRKIYKKACMEAKRLGNEVAIGVAKNSCKKAWDLINSVRKGKTKEEVSISPDNFNRFFINSVNEIADNKDNSNKGPPNCDDVWSDSLNAGFSFTESFSFKQVTSDKVLSIVNNLKTTNSLDIFDMSCNVIKKVIDCIVCPLTYCINKCLMEGVFPDMLKLARVVPVYKKGDKMCPSSYRPISLVPIFSKIIEAIVKEQMTTYLEMFNIITNSQFGFRAKKNTIAAIEVLITKVFEAFENKGLALAVFCDLSKAFDCVNHKKLLRKLRNMGFKGTSLKFLESYLKNRKQIVCIGGKWSKEALVEHGVPQGSVLGPLLFILMVNDLPSFLKSLTIQYADDTTLIEVDTDIDRLTNKSNETVLQATQWFKDNGFLLNVNKTQKLLFSLKGCVDSVNGSVKFLGLHIDNKLSWDSHVLYVSSKLSKVVYLLRSLKWHVPDKFVKSAYFAFFHSVMSYGLLFWGNSSHVQSILLLQKKAVRILANAPYREHCRPIFKQLGIMTVVNLYIYTVLLHSKETTNFQLRQAVHMHNTRNSKKIDIPYNRLSKTQKSYEVMGMKLLNKLPLQITSLPLPKFKIKIHNFLVESPFYSVQEFFNCNVNALSQ